MKNYYEILEVSENASPEVIEKAYKTLVKKYHPDLQPSEKKQEAENKIKMINEAYDTLSNSQKKETYDRQLKMQKIKEEQKRTIKNPLHTKQETDTNFAKQQEEYNRAINEAYNNAYQNAYQQAYINNLKNMGYQIKYERTWKEKIRTFFAAILAIVFLLVICFILWHIPFIRNYLIDLYQHNDIVRIFVDIINNIVNSFFSLFTGE